MSEVSYAFTRTLPGRGFTEVVQRARDELAVEGFGVLTEIDVQATLKKKLGVERRPYLILGACNPPLAHRALTAEPAIGVLLPCNVDVVEGEDGTVSVQAVNPRELFKVVRQPGVEEIAEQVAQKLERVLARI